MKKILIVRRDNIGDLVCTTPAIFALRKRFPGAEIGVLVNSYNADVLRGNPNIDRFLVYTKLKHSVGFINRCAAILNRLKIIMQLRLWNPDVTILAKSGYDKHGLNLVRKFGAKNVIGYVSDSIHNISILPDICIKEPDYLRTHEVEAINMLLSPLGINDALSSLKVYPNPKQVNKFAASLPSATQKVVIHISAREPERGWAIKNFIMLIEEILKAHPDFLVLLLWAPGKPDDPLHPGDDEKAHLILQTVDNQRLVPIPTHSLSEGIAAISLGDIFIGSDGGAMHLAVALNKKVLALFENLPDKLNHWYPWKAESKIVHGSGPTVASITLDMVKESFEGLLNKQNV